MPRLAYQAKSLPLQRELGRVAPPSARSNGPTDPLHAAKDTICVLLFDKKDPKLSLSELLSMMTRIQFNLILFI
jgi:hypothetical protein